LRRVLSVAEVIPLDAAVIWAAENSRRMFKLGHQDSIIYASVISHLHSFGSENNCFLNRNSNDFKEPDMIATLNESNCKMLLRFDKGLEYISNFVN
jgi:hypothetical protein